MFQKPDIPFTRDDSQAYAPWVIAAMVCVVALLLCVGLALQQSLSARQVSAGNILTIHIPSSENQEAVSEKLLTQLRESKSVEKADRMSDKQLRALLGSWIDGGDVADALPLPTVLEVSYKNAAAANKALPAVESLVKEVAPDAVLDTGKIWAEKFKSVTRMVQWAMFLLAAALLSAMVALIVFIARASMHLHARSVKVLHGLGADDMYITKQFQHYAATLGFKGAAMGGGLAAVLFIAASLYVQALDVPFSSMLKISGSHAVLLILLPFICALLSLVSARMAVDSQLKALP